MLFYLSLGVGLICYASAKIIKNVKKSESL